MDDFWKRTKQDDDESFNQFPYVPFPRPIPVPIPGIFDPPTKCLVINVEWAARFMGACEALDQVDVWLTDPAGAEAARNQIREALASWMTGEGCLMVDPCCPETNELLIDIELSNQFLIERSEYNAILNRYQVLQTANQQIAFQLEILDDHVEYHSYAPSAPDISFSEDSGDSTTELETAREAALCSAVNRYVEQSAFMTTNVANAGLAAGGAVGGFITAAAAAAAIALWPIGLIVGAGIAVASALWNGAMNDPEGRRKVKCCMYDNLLGQTITFENFQACVEDCSFDPSSSEGVIAGAIHRLNQQEGNFRAFVSILGGEMSTLIPGGSLNACDCSCGTPVMVYGTMDDHGDGSYTMRSVTGDLASNVEGRQVIAFNVPGCCEIIDIQEIVSPQTHSSTWINCEDVSADYVGGAGAPLNESFKYSAVSNVGNSAEQFSFKYILNGG